MSEETVTEALLEFLNAAEAGIAAAKQRIKEAKALWDPSKIKWTKAEGSKGPYERSEDINNLEFKTMLKDLATHAGRLTRDGLFYRTFQNGHTVGRKPQKKD